MLSVCHWLYLKLHTTTAGPQYCRLQTVMHERVYQKPVMDVDELNQPLIEMWSEIQQDCLIARLKAKGKHW